MTASDTSGRGLERLICTALTGAPCDPRVPANVVQQRPATDAAGWICGAAEDFDRECCVDLAQFTAFLRETQPEVADALDLGQDGPTRRKFLARLQGEVSKRAAPSTCCATGSSMARTTSTSSTARPRRATPGPPSAMRPTVSASRDSCATAATRRKGRSIWACSSTACRFVAVDVYACVYSRAASLTALPEAAPGAARGRAADGQSANCETGKWPLEPRCPHARSSTRCSACQSPCAR